MGYICQKIVFGASFNRTIVELKSETVDIDDLEKNSFNRTIVELKYN